MYTHKQAQTCSVRCYSGAIWQCRCTGAKHTRTHTQAQPVLAVESEGTHWPNFPQLARLVGDQRSSAPVSPNQAYQSTHSLTVSLCLPLRALHLFLSVYTCSSVRLAVKCTALMFRASSWAPVCGANYAGSCARSVDTLHPAVLFLC